MHLDLQNLSSGMPGLTPACGTALAEAAAVCLEKKGHEPGVQCTVTGVSEDSASIAWKEVNDQQRNAHADLQDATEEGAMGIAILAIKGLTGLTVAERAAKGTGVDYWLGQESLQEEEALPFQNKARLEVSGILAGDLAAIKARTRIKLGQTEPTDHICPAFVAIVEFSRPHIHVEAK